MGLIYTVNGEVMVPINQRWQASTRLGLEALPRIYTVSGGLHFLRGGRSNRHLDVGVGMFSILGAVHPLEMDGDFELRWLYLAAGCRWHTKSGLFFRTNAQLLLTAELTFPWGPVWPGVSIGYTF